jgi:hypothetical protein
MGHDGTTCPLCGSTDTHLFLHRQSVPVHQNVMLPDAEAARSFPRGELAMSCCHRCGFIFNAAFEPGLLRYGAEYDNRQDCSGVFQSHVDDLTDELLGRCSVRDSRIIEVGCGDGSFLRKLVADPAMGNIGYGFDPAYVGPESDVHGRAHFASKYFDAGCTQIAADVLICRHVIEHVPDPLQLLTTARQALDRSPNARVFFETPCVDWILKGQIVWDFFYEHCSLFSSGSLVAAMQSSGFAVAHMRNLFGGQYLWLEGSVAHASVNGVHVDAGGAGKLAEDYGHAHARQTNHWRRMLKHCAELGPVALWGAGAKGATFAGLIDPDCTLIACLIDINPNKQGKFLPGSGHRIVSPQQISERRIATIMVLNPNYQDEIQRTVDDAALDVALVDMMADSESRPCN